jgi:RluA family pseudouridine synthase
MTTYRNIAAYRFARMTDLKPLRERLFVFCRDRELKGTILLSPEGINLFVAGSGAAVDALVAELRALPGMADLDVKVSESTHQPFNRMLVRIKKEIIAFGVEGIDPGIRTSPKLPAKTLKQWLDDGREVVLLDTRNDYEVKLGTFKNARPIGVDTFRAFPEAVRRLPEEMKDRPIVMFCTGGIRCEKAGPFMEREGFKEVYQLEGGILKYFEECGEAHYDGECFVFDQRVGVDPGLRETVANQCFACLAPLTFAEQRDERYVEGRSCPHCFKTPEEMMAETIARRQRTIAQVVQPLPGSQPYDNYRPITVPEEDDGGTVLAAYCRVVRHLSEEYWRSEFARGLIVDVGRRPVSPDHEVRAGERYWHKYPDVVEPDVNADIRILHEDAALVVIHKPAPLPMHAGGRFNRNTLNYILDRAFHPEKLRPSHRLDANTTGVVVHTKTRHHASKVQPQFANGSVVKHYLVRAQGQPAWEEHVCEAPISSEAGAIGSREVDEENGLASRTGFRVLQRLADGTALMEARPFTGRTNQIRVHLWHLGFPVVGDPAYLPGGVLGDVQTLPTGDNPLCLHSWRISLVHPITGERVEYSAPPPSWAVTPSSRSTL